MRYLGGKMRQGGRIADYIIANWDPECKLYVEPFCGALGAAMKVIPQLPKDVRIVLSDLHPALMTTWMASLDGWVPPDTVSEADFKQYKAIRDPNDPMTAYVGFGMAFAASWFGGYARSKKGDMSASLKRMWTKKVDILKAHRDQITLVCVDYLTYENYTGATFYLDPPYAGRSAPGPKGKFDSQAYWAFAEHLTKANHVTASEFIAPPNWKPVVQFGDTIAVAHKQETACNECLFAYEPGWQNVGNLAEVPTHPDSFPGSDEGSQYDYSGR